MNILVINGSHRVGNTKRFVETAQKVLADKGHSVRSLDLLEKRFDICNGCLVCEESGECVLTDAFTTDIVSALKSADAYVFASPVYFNTVTALFKSFIDRTNCLCGYYEENKKKLAVFLVGQADEESLASALEYIKEYAEIMHFEVAENNICVIAREADELAITNDIKNIVTNWF